MSEERKHRSRGFLGIAAIVQIFGRPQSFVAGPPINGVEFMVKDSKKYASTGGWGFAHIEEGKPVDKAMLKSCFDCHALIKDRDLVFTRYAP